MVGLGSSWGPACGHSVQPGAQFCDVCGASASAGALPPPPSPDSRHPWPPPPAAQPVSPFSLASDTLPTELPSADGQDPWASWYGKPRAALPQDPSSNLPDVYGTPTGYGEAPPYGGTQQYGGDQQYGQYVGPAEYGAGQQPYGATQRYGPGQQYPGGTAFGDQGYGGVTQYADFQQPGGSGGPGSPQGPRGQRGPRSRGPLVPILAIGGVAAAAIAGLVIATSGSGGSSPSSVSSTAATTPPSQASAAQQAAAQQLNTLLSQSGNDHSDVVGAVLDVEACKSLRGARTTFATAAANRNKLLVKLGTLPNKAALPPALLTDLTAAWQASAQADTDLHDWAQNLISGGCHKGKTHDDQKYKDSLGPDSTASSAKARFSKEWQPLAQKYDLPVYKTGQL